MKKKLVLVGLIIFLIILSQVNLSVLINVLLNINLFFLLIVFVLSVLSLVIRSIKWKFLIEKASMKLNFFDLLKFYFIGLFLGILTPGRIGEFSKSIYVNKKIKSLPVAIATVIMDRLIDIIVLVMTGLFSFIAFAFIFRQLIFSTELISIIAIIFFIGIIFFFKLNYLHFLLKPMFNFMIPEKYKERVKSHYLEFFISIKKMKKTSLLIFSLAISISSWFVSISASYVLSLSLGLNIPFEFFFLVHPIITLLDILPISVSGIGTRELVLIFLFSFYSVPAETAIAFGIIYMLIAYWAIALIGFLIYLKNPIEIKL